MKNNIKYLEQKLNEESFRENFQENAIIEYCNICEELGDLYLNLYYDKTNAKDLWNAGQYYEKATWGPLEYQIAESWEYDIDLERYIIDYDYFNKPSLEIVEDKLKKTTKLMEDNYINEAWVDKPSWITIADFYYIVQISKEHFIVKEVINYVLKEYYISYYQDNVFLKPIWMDRSRYEVIQEYLSFVDNEIKEESINLIIHILKNSYLTDFIQKSGLLDILDIIDIDNLIDYNYIDSRGNLFFKIDRVFYKMFWNRGKDILIAHGLYSDQKSISLFEIPDILHGTKEFHLEGIFRSFNQLGIYHEIYGESWSECFIRMIDLYSMVRSQEFMHS